MPLFGPDYGAAQTHINELTQEREDFIQANLSQAASIASLTNQVAELKDDLATALEQMSVQALISESRARQIEEGRIREEEQEHRITKLRSGVRVLWGMMQEMQMRTREQAESVSAGNELLESLSELLSSERSKDKGADADQP